LLDQIPKVKPRFRGALENGRQDAVLSKKLATIRCDLDLPFDPAKFHVRPPDRDRLAKIFTELEFTKFLQDLDAAAPKKLTISYEKYRLITTADDLQRLVEELGKCSTVAVDLETTSVDPMRAKIVGFSLCGCEGQPAYVPVAHNYLGVPSQLPLEAVIAAVKPVLTNPKIAKVAQNATYELLTLRRHGIE